MAIAMLSAAMAAVITGEDSVWQTLAQVPGWATQVLKKKLKLPRQLIVIGICAMRRAWTRL
jgi:hypothetical protein